jgi:large subunit ribosomal protein L12
MEYIYAALLLHNAGKAVTEDAVTAVLQAAGIEVNEARVKALVAALEGVDIEEAISKAAFAAPAAEEEEEEEDTSEEDGMAGLGALFG